ncbi:MAG TPA: HNH endonuclease [Chthonomonadaceae bacterium]|nr:HNH endonuclease [Chthonomonadaceae bacterium]
MIFSRSIPKRNYRDYRLYRPLLRQDFQHRCAYCLIHEFFVGGEAGFEIDHHRPLHGPYARPDLEAVYTNLYWSCSECNANKGDTWPSPEEYEMGVRFLDPCQPDDDHDLHWKFHPDGTLQALTLIGAYTEEKLLLWRPFLQERRAQQFRDQEEAEELEARLKRKQVNPGRRRELEQRLAEIKRRLEPPIFDRARWGDRIPHA